MTCIAAVIDGKDIYMGGDSAGVAGYSMEVRADEKVFVRGDYCMGFTSSFRMGQLLRYALLIPKHPPRMNVMRFMSTLFIDSVRECLKKGGYATVDNSVETGGTFIVGYKNKLFKIENDFQVGLLSFPFVAVGCGATAANGAFLANYKTDMPAKSKVLQALKAAEQFSAGVRGPFKIVRLREREVI